MPSRTSSPATSTKPSAELLEDRSLQPCMEPSTRSTRSPEARALNQVQRPEVYRERLIDSAGTRIALSVWEADDPAAPVVVFLPGTMTHPLFYEEFLHALHQEGFTVVGVHLAGHGKSPRLRRRRDLTWDLMVRNAVDAVDWAGRSYPTAPRVVLGSSQGGVLALAVAAQADGLAGVFAHNVLDPALATSLTVTRVPPRFQGRLEGAYPTLRRATALLGRLAPTLPVPFGAYLEMARVSSDPAVEDYFYTDPLGLRSYPLQLLAGMLTADLPGPARCPVTVIAAAGDPLFSLDYTRSVFDRIHAPTKELLLVEANEHLIFNAAIDRVLPALVPRLRTAPETRHTDGNPNATSNTRGGVAQTGAGRDAHARA